MANILFIFEGEVTEVNYYKIIEKCFKEKIKSKVNFYCYKTNIHVLYDEIKEDKSLDIIEIIKNKAKKANDDKNYKMLNENKFGEVYLIFDLEPHDSRFNVKKIQEMLELFNNETEHGKLYINYPMIESFKHFRSIPDPNFNKYKIKIQDCLTYKNDVAKISCINDYRKIGKDKYFSIVKQNLNKINLLVNNLEKCDYSIYSNSLNQEKIFKVQQEELRKNEQIYIINSLSLWPLDYFNKEFFDFINDYIV